MNGNQILPDQILPSIEHKKIYGVYKKQEHFPGHLR